MLLLSRVDVIRRRPKICRIEEGAARCKEGHTQRDARTHTHTYRQRETETEKGFGKRRKNTTTEYINAIIQYNRRPS